jgi:hypothetical protein
MAASPTEYQLAWQLAEHEAELLRVARYRSMPLRERLLALERRGRLLARLKQQRTARAAAANNPPPIS